MSYMQLPFGKHKGKTLPQVMFTDPDWFFFFYEERRFRNPRLKEEAKEIYHKSRYIIIPSPNGSKLVAEYTFLPYNGGFTGLELVPKSRLPHEGSSITFRSNVIDFRVIYSSKGYAKSAYQRFIRNVKFYLFDTSKYIMTKERCEDFFSCESHFRPKPNVKAQKDKKLNGQQPISEWREWEKQDD